MMKNEVTSEQASVLEKNKQVMQQFIRFINTGDRSIGETIIAPEVIFYAPTSPEPLHGFEGYMDVLRMMRGAMPDVQWNAEEVIAEGDKVMIRFHDERYSDPAFHGYARHRQTCPCDGHEHLRTEDSKIVREHSVPDLFSMLMQLGMLPVPGSK